MALEAAAITGLEGLAGGVTQAAQSSMAFTEGMSAASSATEKFLRSSGGLLGSLAAIPGRFFSAADAGREYRKVLYEIGIYTDASTKSLYAYSDSLMAVSTKTRIGVTVLAELSAGIAKSSEITSINTRSLEETTILIEKAFGTVSRESITQFLTIQQRYPDLLKKIKEGIPQQEMQKFINTIYLLGDAEQAKFVEEMVKRLHGGAQELDKGFIFSQERVSAWEHSVERSITNVGKSIATLHPLATDALKGIGTAAELYLGSFLLRKVALSSAQIVTDFKVAGGIIGTLALGKRRDIGLGAAGEGGVMVGAGSRNLMGGLLVPAAIGGAAALGTYGLYRAAGGESSAGIKGASMGIGMMSAGTFMAATGLGIIPGLITFGIGAGLYGKGMGDNTRENIDKSLSPYKEKYEGSNDLTMRMLGAQARGLRPNAGMHPGEFAEATENWASMKGFKERFEWTGKTPTETEKLAAAEEINRIYSAGTLLQQRSLQAEYQLISAQKTMGVSAGQVNVEYDKMQKNATLTADASQKAYESIKALLPEDAPQVEEARARAEKDKQVAMSVTIDKINMAKDIAASQNTLLESQMNLYKGMGDFAADHNEILEQQENSLAISLSKQELITQEYEKQGSAADSAAVARSKEAENTIRLQQWELNIQKNIFNVRDKEVFLATQHQSRVESALNAAKEMAVPFSLVASMQKQISDDAGRTYNAQVKALDGYEKELAIKRQSGQVTGEENAKLEELKTSVAQAGASYISAMAYQRRGWLEGFTESWLGGADPGKTNAGINRSPSQMAYKGSAWEQGSTLTPVPIEDYDKMTLRLLGINDPNKRQYSSTWTGDRERENPTTKPGEASLRTWREVFTEKAMNDISVDTSKANDIGKETNTHLINIERNTGGSVGGAVGGNTSVDVAGGSSTDTVSHVESDRIRQHNEYVNLIASTGTSATKGNVPAVVVNDRYNVASPVSAPGIITFSPMPAETGTSLAMQEARKKAYTGVETPFPDKDYFSKEVKAKRDADDTQRLKEASSIAKGDEDFFRSGAAQLDWEHRQIKTNNLPSSLPEAVSIGGKAIRRFFDNNLNNSYPGQAVSQVFPSYETLHGQSNPSQDSTGKLRKGDNVYIQIDAHGQQVLTGVVTEVVDKHLNPH